jgi:hypothetical protein
MALFRLQEIDIERDVVAGEMEGESEIKTML